MKATKANLDMSGTRMGDHTIVRLIGKGGIGSVYLAKNEKTGTQEALKILLPEMIKSSEMRERFEREIENSAILRHPNIVKLTGHGQSDGIWYYTMEYCMGGSLNDLLIRDGMPAPAKACDIILQVLDGLEYAHNVEIPNVKLNDGSWVKGHGLIHRDIKPENILIMNIETEKRSIGETEKLNSHTGDPASSGNFAVAGRRQETGSIVAKISDFGLAKSYRSAGQSGHTQTGSVGGSLAFISRQQLINYKYSKPEVDVWSATAVLYFLLTAKTPRSTEGEKNPFNAILKNNPIPIRNVAPSVPARLAAIIDRALDDSGPLFYKKASDLKRELEEFQALE